MLVLEPGPNASQIDGPSAGSESRTLIHSHHYNLALLRVIFDADRLDARRLLEPAAAELAFRTLREREGTERWAEPERWLREAAELFRVSGLGVLQLAGVGERGGEARVAGSHFALGWTQKFGRADRCVCAFVAGYLSGALAAAYERPYEVAETGCLAKGDPECHFRVAPAAGDLAFFTAAPPAAPPLPAPVLSALADAEVEAALLDPPPTAGADGQISALGGTITRLWADYYNRVSFQFEQEFPRVMGPKFATLPALVLTEAGHTSAFHTFSGVMRSPEWEERVLPRLQTREDWLHAAIALINALGWGAWRVHALVGGERATIRVADGYEALGYRRYFGRADSPKCYLTRGTVAGLMNLLYVGDPTQRPALTPSYYNQLFRSPLSFRAVETRCRAMGDPYCEFIANPLSMGLRERMLAKR